MVSRLSGLGFIVFLGFRGYGFWASCRGFVWGLIGEGS